MFDFFQNNVTIKPFENFVKKMKFMVKTPKYATKGAFMKKQ